MAKDEIIRSQRKQVNKQIKEHLGSGNLVDFSDRKNTSAIIYSENIPDVPVQHVDKLLWRGYWFIYEQPGVYVPSPSSIETYVEVSVNDPTNSQSSMISQEPDGGKFFYEFIYSGSDYNEYRYVNLGVYTTFIPAVTGAIPITFAASVGDRVALYQDGILLTNGYSQNGGRVTASINLRKNTRTTLSLQFYSPSYKDEDSPLSRFARIYTNIANYVLAYGDAKPDTPTNLTAIASDEGNRVTWNISSSTAQYVAGTEVYHQREDDNSFHLSGIVEGLETEFIHNKDIYDHFPNGDLEYSPIQIHIGGGSWEYESIFIEGYGNVHSLHLSHTDNGWENYAYSADQNEFFRWRFGSDDDIPLQADCGIYLYHVDNRGDSIGELRSHASDYALEFPTDTFLDDRSLEGILDDVLDCPNSSGFWCLALNPNEVSAGSESDRHFALGIDDIIINGNYDYRLTFQSRLALTGKYDPVNGFEDYSEDDAYAEASPTVYYKVKAVVDNSYIVEDDSWVALGTVLPSLNGWGFNSMVATAEDMTAAIVELIPEGSVFVVSAIQFKFSLLDDELDYDSVNDNMYYKMWLLGGVDLFPVQGATLESGVEYTYKVRHFTNGHILSEYSDTVSVVAVMPQAPTSVDVNMIDVEADTKWNNITPLEVVVSSLSELQTIPRLEMKHTGSSNIYGASYIEPAGPDGWVSVPVGAITEGMSDPDHLHTKWTIQAQHMKDMGFWAEWLYYTGLDFPSEITDYYSHQFTQHDRYEFRVVASPVGEEVIDIEHLFYAVYDTEPPSCYVEVTDLYSRLSSSIDGYVLHGGKSLLESPSSNSSEITVRFMLKIPETTTITGLSAEYDWRADGSKFRYLIVKNIGVDLHKPISLLEYEWDPLTTYIYGGFGSSTVQEYYEDNFVDYYGNTVSSYDHDYVYGLKLNEDYDEWHEYNRDTVHEVSFTLEADDVLIGVDIYIEVENSIGERFEYGLYAIDLSSIYENYLYKTTSYISSLTGYKFIEDIIKPHNPIQSPASGGVINKWSTYEKARISSVNPITLPEETAWNGDTIAITGTGLDYYTYPFSPILYHTEGDSAWDNYSAQAYNLFPNPIRAITVNKATETIYFGGPIKLDNEYPEEWAILGSKQPGVGNSVSYFSLSGYESGTLYSLEYYNDNIHIFGDIVASGFGALGDNVGWRLDNNGFLSGAAATPTGWEPKARGSFVHSDTIYVCGGETEGWVGTLIPDYVTGGDYISVLHSHGEIPYPVNDVITVGNMIIIAVGNTDGGNTYGNIMISIDGGFTFEYVYSGSFNGSVQKLQEGGVGEYVYIGGLFDTHTILGSNYGGAARLQVINEVQLSSPETMGTGPGATPEVFGCKLHTNEYDKYIYYFGRRILKRWNVQTELWEDHPVSVAGFNAFSYVHDMHTYDYNLQGALLPPDFRRVYEELNGSPPDWPACQGPFLCMFIGELPSLYSDPVEYPFLNQAFISSRTASTAGIVGNAIDGFVFRLANPAITDSYLRYLGDSQYGPPYSDPSEWRYIDNGYEYAKRVSTYVVRHFNPSSVLTSVEFLDDYVRAAVSPVSPDSDIWNNCRRPGYGSELPATTHVATPGSNSVYDIFNAAGILVTPKISPVSNLFAFMLDCPPGVDVNDWEAEGGSTVTMLCFPMSDTTGAQYNDPDGLMSLGELNPGRLAVIGGIELQETITPTTDYLHISSRKNTKVKELSGYLGSLNDRQASVYTPIPGFIPTYSLKHMTNQSSILENATVVYSSLFNSGLIVDTNLDSTSGSYSFGPRVATDEENQRIENHTLIVTDLGESYIKSEFGAKSYDFNPFDDVVDPATGDAAHINRWWGGSQYNMASNEDILDSRMTIMHGSHQLHLFSCIKRDSAGSTISLQGYREFDYINNPTGRLTPSGNAVILDPPGTFQAVYYDVLPKVSGDGFYLVTCRGPSPYDSVSNSSGGVEEDNWSFYFHDYSFNTGGGITHLSSTKFNFTLDGQTARESWGVYGFREPSLAWVGYDSNHVPIIAMSFVIDYGYHSDTYDDSLVYESRISLTLVKATDWTFKTTRGYSPYTGVPVVYIVRIVSPSSFPPEWEETGYARFAGYGRHYSPQIWTNCIIKNGDISATATTIHVPYIINNIDLDSDYEGQQHRWNSGKTRQIDAFGHVHYCVRKFDSVGEEDDFENLVPYGEQFRSMGINGGQFVCDQDNWGNVVVGYTTKPDADKMNEYNYDKLYPQYRILKIERVINNMIDIDMAIPIIPDRM